MLYLKLRKKLHKIAKEYKVKLRFREFVSFGGDWYYGTIRISIKNTTKREIISNFFHELGHHIDYTNKLYPSFYNSKSSWAKLRRISLKAERHADKVGQQLCKKYFPKIKFMRSYLSENNIKYNKLYYSDGRTKLGKIKNSELLKLSK